MITQQDFDNRKAKLIESIINDHIQKMERVENHTHQMCQDDKHILEERATGWGNGHYITRCQLCDFVYNLAFAWFVFETAMIHCNLIVLGVFAILLSGFYLGIW